MSQAQLLTLSLVSSARVGAEEQPAIERWPVPRLVRNGVVVETGLVDDATVGVVARGTSESRCWPGRYLILAPNRLPQRRPTAAPRQRSSSRCGCSWCCSCVHWFLLLVAGPPCGLKCGFRLRPAGTSALGGDVEIWWRLRARSS